MDHFVRGMLEADERFVKLAEREARAQKFIVEILDKAQGVFLWVYLVVRSLLRGLDKHDDIAILEKRLNALPLQLEEYFEHILDSIESIYQDHTARTFQLAIRAMPLPLTAFWYIPLEIEDPNCVLNSPIEPLNDREAEDFQIRATRCINAWCRDLLEVHQLPADKNAGDTFLYHKVDFLHRTVRDFLMTKDMQSSLDSRIQTGLNLWLTLVRVHLLEAKHLQVTSGTDLELKNFLHVASDIMFYAREYKIHLQASPTELIEHLDWVGNHFRAIDKTDFRSHWTNVGLLVSNSDFVAYAVSFGLIIYVRTALDREPLLVSRKAGWPFLNFALQNPFRQNYPHATQLPLLEMLQLLIDYGADINETLPKSRENRTIWPRFLRRCYETAEADLWPAAQILLNHGADVHVKVQIDTKPRIVRSPKWKKANETDVPVFVTALECLKRCCHRDNWPALERRRR